MNELSAGLIRETIVPELARIAAREDTTAEERAAIEAAKQRLEDLIGQPAAAPAPDQPQPAIRVNRGFRQDPRQADIDKFKKEI